MNIPQEAIDHLLETSNSYTGWLSNMRVLNAHPETAEVEIVTGETIDVGQAVEEVLLVVFPLIRAQIAAAIQRRKRDLAEGYSDIALAMLEAGMEEAARIAEEGITK